MAKSKAFENLSFFILTKCTLLLLFASSYCCYSQNTVTSGNWSDPTVWSGGAVPIASGTVSVNNPITIDSDLSPTGTWTFNSNTTDQPAGTAFTFNPAAGTNSITISSGVTVTFGGGTSATPNAFGSGTIDIYGTLILGYTQLNNSGNLIINVKSGGTLIINGDLINKNNSGSFDIAGAVIIYGNYDGQTGSTTVSGSGTINATGSITTTGGSTVFGYTNDCTTGPCSGSSLACSFTNIISPTSKAVCTSSVAGTLTATTSGTSPSYQWLSSTDNVTYSNATGTSTNSSYITPALTQTTWYKVRVTSSSCTSISAPTKVTVLPAGGWLGGTSNDWGTTSNWCSGVPTSSTSVVISNAAGVTNMPTINAGTAAVCKDITINNSFPSSTLTLAASSTASLSIFGDFINNGSFTDNSTAATAGVMFVGTSQQTISGTTANTFNNLTINNTSGSTPAINVASNNVIVASNLTLTSGIVNLNGFMITLGTTAASTGTLNFSSGTRFYGGNIARWFPTSAVTIGASASLFPIGTVASYRPIYFGSSGLSAAGGTIKVSHTGTTGSSAVSFSDAGTAVQVRSNSFWTVTTANGISSTGTPFSIRTEATGMGTVGTIADLRLTLASAASPGSAGTNAGTTSNPQVNRTAMSVANLSNNFYWGSVNSVQTPLPVTLLSFMGASTACQIDLVWKTSSEVNSDYFVIEKSTDGATFTDMTHIKSEAISHKIKYYTWTDVSPVIGANYYRLKMIDRDGSFEYSEIINIIFSDNKEFTVFPNPSNGSYIKIRRNVIAKNAFLQLSIFDAFGALVHKSAFDDESKIISFEDALSPGVYIIKLSGPNTIKIARFSVN